MVRKRRKGVTNLGEAWEGGLDSCRVCGRWFRVAMDFGAVGGWQRGMEEGKAVAQKGLRWGHHFLDRIAHFFTRAQVPNPRNTF